MFSGIESTVSDLLLFDRNSGDIPLRVSLPEPAVVRAILQIAAGKVPEHAGRPIAASVHGEEIAAATRFIASQLLAPGADYFRTLGLPPDADARAIRDHFRRLMSLVHPDSNPVGYPDDAAIRVNRAYSVLSADDSRTQYLATLGGGDFAVVASAARVGTDGRGGARKPSAAPKSSVWRSWSDKIRARHNLLLLAIVLALPAIWFALTALRPESPVRLVEANRREVSGTIVTSKSSASPAQSSGVSVAAVDGSSPHNPVTQPAVVTIPPEDIPQSVAAGTSASPAPAAQPATVSRAAAPLVTPLIAAERARRSAPESGCQTGCATSLASELSPRSMSLVAAKSAPSLVPASPMAGASIPAALPAPPPSSSEPGIAPVAPSTAPVTREAARTSSAPVSPTGSLAAGTPPSGRSADAKALEPVSTTRPPDVDDLLVRFSSAYEAGSMSAFSQLFSTSMAGRRQLLNEYERVFVSTRSRAIKFGQLKQSAIGDRLALAGYATVTTVDTDNRSSTQRVFLEFEIGRDRGEPRIARLANYALN